MRRRQKQISPSYLGLAVFSWQAPTKINQSRLKINRGSRIVYSVETGSTSKWLGQQASGYVNKQVVGSVDIPWPLKSCILAPWHFFGSPPLNLGLTYRRLQGALA